MNEAEGSIEAARIRPARVEDSAGIARLATELGYPATGADMADRLAVLLARPEHFVAVAEAGDGLLGCVAMEKRLLLVAGKKAELMALIVAPEARHRGTGKALVAAAEGWAKSQGLETITVRSNVARAESHPFYERIGYVRGKTQHVYVGKLARRRP